MTWTVADIIEATERLAPPELAETWDNIGLQVGHPDWPVKKVWVALDPLPGVVADGIEAGVDLLITHHPLMFKPLKSIDCKTHIGAIIQMALENRLAIFSAHTNLDAVSEGVNDALAGKLGLRNLNPLITSSGPGQKGRQTAADDNGIDHGVVQGLGRIGSLDQEMNLGEFALMVKDHLGLDHVTMAGDPALLVKQVALCSGSGSSLMGAFMASEAHVYVSGDLRYHDARDAEIAGRGLIDIGHFDSEHLIVDVLAGRLAAEMGTTAEAVEIEAYRLEENPFITL